jgi:hypothetical protein
LLVRTNAAQGVPGVLPEKLAEGMEARHCALSLVGEPIMYPEINKFVRLLHSKVTVSRINIFLVTKVFIISPNTVFSPSEDACFPPSHYIRTLVFPVRSAFFVFLSVFAFISPF